MQSLAEPQSGLVCGLQLWEMHGLGAHGRVRRAGARGHGVLVADKSLRVEFERFAHELGDANKYVSMF